MTSTPTTADVVADLDDEFDDAAAALAAWLERRRMRGDPIVNVSAYYRAVGRDGLIAEIRRYRRRHRPRTEQHHPSPCTQCDGAWRTDTTGHPIRKCDRLTTGRCPDNQTESEQQ